MRQQHLAIAAIVVLAAFVTLFRIGAADICSANEAAEALAVQQMVEHGALLFPLINGRDPAYKPPLFHWTATAIDHLLGVSKVTAANLRWPSAFYATGGVLLAALLTARLMGLESGLLAGLILLGSYQYVDQARLGRVDMTLTFFETLALFSLAWWMAERGEPDSSARRARGSVWPYVFALAVGAGVLAKGPVGALLPLAAAAIFLLIERRWSEIRALALPGPMILAIVLGSAWYVACAIAGRYGFLHKQLGHENLGRFFGALGAMPAWYYVKPLLLNSAPLSLIAPVAVGAALLRRPRDGSGSDAARAAARMLAIFWVVTVLFFWLAAYKRRSYLLPLWPPAAVVIVWWLGSFAAPSAKVIRRGLALLCAGLIVFNLAYIPRREVRECGDDSYREAAETITRVVGPEEPLFTYGVGVGLLPLLFYLDRDAPDFRGQLADAPPGYIIVPATAWAAEKAKALDLEPVLTAGRGSTALVLLRRGKIYADGMWNAAGRGVLAPISSAARADRSLSS